MCVYFVLEMDFDFTQSALGLANEIREKRISSEDLVDHFIQQIQLWNPHLNALVEERFSLAREEARACDEFLVKSQPRSDQPLFGVPITMKEMIAVAGMKSTAGSVHRADQRSTYDATVVARLKSAGAIVLGTTNVSEIGLWFESENPVYGATKNPFDFTRTCGGSSGGEAALLGAGASPLGIGSDIGGSLRIPAAFCGIFSYKPSEKWIPLTGHFAYSREEVIKVAGPSYPITVIGPMARFAQDLILATQIIKGPDEWDPETKSHNLKLDTSDWRGRKVWILAEPNIFGVPSAESEVVNASMRAARHFESLGAKVMELPQNLFRDTFQLWSSRCLQVEQKSFTEHLSYGKGLSYGAEFARWIWDRAKNGKPRYQLTSLITGVVSELSAGQSQRMSRKLQDLDLLRQKVADLLGDENILVLPPHPRRAPKLSSTLIRPFDFCYTAIVNALGLPAAVAPMGLAGGLPVSAQVVAGADRDHLCLGAMIELERAFGGYVGPSHP
jgi:fatty acid amide hydrolase 2